MRRGTMTVRECVSSGAGDLAVKFPPTNLETASTINTPNVKPLPRHQIQSIHIPPSRSPICIVFFTMSASQDDAHGTTAPTAAPVSANAAVRRRRATVENTTARRLDVIDLDQVIARVPAHNTPLNANDDSLAYFDAGEVDCDVEDTADEDTDPAMATDRSRWEAHEVMQLAWIRHDYDAQYRGQTRLQGQNRDVMLFEKLRERHPEFRHNLAAVKAKVFRMEAQYRRVGDLLLNASGKGRPPKLPIFYDIFDRILGDRANARPPALAAIQDAASPAPIRPMARLRTPVRQHTASSPSRSPSNPPLTQPPASRVSDDEPTDAATTASPVRSHVLGARTGASLRGRGVNRRPGPATGSEVNTGNDPGEHALGIMMNASDSTSCREIAGIIAQSVTGAMQEQFAAFMDRTQELVESARDVRASRKRRGTPPSERDDVSE
ncbi:unnamed protein product [Closterium sp. NIES-54]